MLKVEINEEFTAKLSNNVFFHFADNSTMGIIIYEAI